MREDDIGLSHNRLSLRGSRSGVLLNEYPPHPYVLLPPLTLCDALSRASGQAAVITDRDSCIAVGGVPRRELADKRLSHRVEELMEGRQSWQSDGERVPVCEDSDKYRVAVAVPILSEGDVLGCVLFVSAADNARTGDVELKLAQTAAGFLGKHMES